MLVAHLVFLAQGGCILWPGIVNPLARMVVGTMQPDKGFVVSQDPLTTIDRAKYYDLQKNSNIFVCDLFQESLVQVRYMSYHKGQTINLNNHSLLHQQLSLPAQQKSR